MGPAISGRVPRRIVVLSVIVVSLAGCKHAPELKLTWQPSTGDIRGYRIERKIGTTGAFSQIASVGPQVSDYTDSGLTAGTTYCYRVQAFNDAGASPYTEEVCKTAGASR
jgi:hypothetical protein